MNEISLRVTIATLVGETKCTPQEFKELCDWMLVWFKEGQELDKQTEGQGEITHLSTVN